MIPTRAAAALCLGLAGSAGGPYDIPLFPARAAPSAQGHARLVFAHSPFGVAVAADGRAIYDIEITVAGLPSPTSLGAYANYVAWVVTPDLSQWQRLGTMSNGTTVVGQVTFNKFLLVITAEAASAAEHAGPIVLRGYSPSTLLQSFASHPLFRGIY